MDTEKVQSHLNKLAVQMFKAAKENWQEFEYRRSMLGYSPAQEIAAEAGIEIEDGDERLFQTLWSNFDFDSAIEDYLASKINTVPNDKKDIK